MTFLRSPRDNFVGMHGNKSTSWQNYQKETENSEKHGYVADVIFDSSAKIVPKGLARHSIKARQFSILQY